MIQIKEDDWDLVRGAIAVSWQLAKTQSLINASVETDSPHQMANLLCARKQWFHLLAIALNQLSKIPSLSLKNAER